MALAALASIVLGSFGPLPELLAKSNPWRGFEAEDSALLSVRAQTVDFQSSKTDCQGWLKALQMDLSGAAFEPGSELKIWGPWTSQQLSGIESCDDAPCEIKLNPGEVAEMKKTPRESRLKTFLRLVTARAERYLKTQERKEYEFPGAPIDPWAFFAKKGLKAENSPPPLPSLRARKLDFSQGKAKLLHQVVDHRQMVSPGGDSAQVWLRDVYTDHYFDSWGEWTWVRCEARGATVIQALFFELDLMKKNDLVSRIMRGKMRGESEAQGRADLDSAFARLLKEARGNSRNPSPRPGAGH